MPAEQSPIARFLILTAAFIVVVAGMRAAESLLVPFLLSLFVAVICSPFLLWMKGKGLPNGIAILIILVLIILVSVVVSAVVGSSIASFRQDLPEYQERLLAMTAQSLESLGNYGIKLDETLWKESINPGAALRLAGNTLASFGGVMTDAFLILLTVVFILAEEAGFSEKLRAARRDNTVEAINRFTSGVNRYMAIKTAISLLTGGLIFVWLVILGVDYPVLWGLLAFLLNFVPNLGSILAAVPTVLLALVQLGPTSAVLTAAGYVAVNTLVGNGIEPRVMGKGLNLSTLVVFLSLVFWGWVLGPVGMLLSVPLTMTVKIALESFDDTRWIAILLGSSNNLPALEEAQETGEGQEPKEPTKQPQKSDKAKEVHEPEQGVPLAQQPATDQ